MMHSHTLDGRQNGCLHPTRVHLLLNTAWCLRTIHVLHPGLGGRQVPCKAAQDAAGTGMPAASVKEFGTCHVPWRRSWSLARHDLAADAWMAHGTQVMVGWLSALGRKQPLVCGVEGAEDLRRSMKICGRGH